MTEKLTTVLVLLALLFTTPAIAQTTGPGFYRPIRSTDGQVNLLVQTAAEKDFLAAINTLQHKFDPNIFRKTKLRRLGRKVKLLLPYYAKLVESSLKQSAGLHIDVILEMHDDDGLGTFPLSQKRTRLVLEYIQATAVGLEGSGVAEATLTTVISEAVASGKRMGLPSVPGGITALVQKQLAALGTYQYAQTHDKVKLIGTEIVELCDLMYIFQQIRSSIPKDKEPLQWVIDIDDALSHLRSYVAMATFASYLRENNLPRGVVAMGAWHGNDLLKIMRGYGIKGAVYQTLDPEILQKYPGTRLDP